MEKIIFIIVSNIMISVLIYLCIAIVFIIIDKPLLKQHAEKPELAFDELKLNYSAIPAFQQYSARDGTILNYRYYPSQSDCIIIFIHGSGWHSKYFFPLAHYISSQGLGRVYTPDLRGHGVNPANRGDIHYIDQLEDDLADFISMIRKENHSSKIILAGHSSGGGLVIRFAGRKYKNMSDAYLLLSPYLKYNAPTIKKNSGGWTFVHTPRIIGLSMFNNIGIKWLNHLDVIDFNMPKEYRDGTETLTYSYRLNTGFAPENYKKELKSIKQPVLVIAGEADESFDAREFYPEISKYKKDVRVEVLAGVTHMGVVTGEEVRPVIAELIQ